MRGSAMLNKGDLPKALTDFTEAIKHNCQDSIAAYRERARLRLWKDDCRGAIEDLTEVLNRNSKDWECLLARGVLRMRLKSDEDAIADFAEVLQLQPNCYHALLNRAMAFAKRGETEKCLKDVDQALELGAGRQSALYCRAYVFLRQEKWEKTIDVATTALKLPPVPADRSLISIDIECGLLCYRGVARHAIGQWEEAIKDLTESIGKGPTPQSYAIRAIVRAACPDAQFRDGRLALADARVACELTNWTDSNCITILAAAYAEAGRFDEALKYQRKTLADKPYADTYSDMIEKRIELYEHEKPFRIEINRSK